MDAVKLVDVEKGLVEGWAIPFGGPMPGGKDLDGEAFSKDTELFLDAYDKRPILYFHGMDKALGHCALSVPRSSGSSGTAGYGSKPSLT